MPAFRIREPEPCTARATFEGTFKDPNRNGIEDASPNVEITLEPLKGLTSEQRYWIVRDFVREAITRSADRVAKVSIHDGPCWLAHIVFAEADVPAHEQRWHDKWQSLVARYNERYASPEFKEQSSAERIENYRKIMQIIDDELELEKIHDPRSRSFDRADAYRRIVLVAKGVDIH